MYQKCQINYSAYQSSAKKAYLQLLNINNCNIFKKKKACFYNTNKICQMSSHVHFLQYNIIYACKCNKTWIM